MSVYWNVCKEVKEKSIFKCNVKHSSHSVFSILEKSLYLFVFNKTIPAKNDFRFIILLNGFCSCPFSKICDPQALPSLENYDKLQSCFMWSHFSESQALLSPVKWSNDFNDVLFCEISIQFLQRRTHSEWHLQSLGHFWVLQKLSSTFSEDRSKFS